MNPTVKKFNQSLANVFIEGLKDGTSHYTQPWDAGSIPPLSFNPVSGAHYRGGNQLALLFAEWGLDKQNRNPTGDRRWMTYKQAASVGAQVRRGEKSQTLVAWKEIEDKRQQKNEEQDPRRRMVAFPFFVFHASQIDALPPPQKFSERPLDERTAQAQKIVDDLGVPILPGAPQAAYSPVKDRIMMPDREAFRDDPSWMATLLHECAHATGHHSRLDRKFGFDRAKEDYAREELRAEMSSFDMCRRLGVPYDPSQHIAYVNSWISILQKDPAELMRAASDADKIQRFLKVPELVIEKIPTIEHDQGKTRGVQLPDLSEPAPVEQVASHARKREKGITLTL